MHRKIHKSLVVAFTVIALAVAGCSEKEAPQANSGALDTTKLPRVTGAKIVFSSAATTIFTSPDQIGPTADAITKALTTAGWQKYVAPHTSTQEMPTLRVMTWKKDTHAINVMITVAPAQNNAISVQYAELPLKTDLPFTPDAADIQYSPDQPALILTAAEPVDKLLDFYRKEMPKRGWFLWSEKTNGKQTADGPSGTIHERGGFAHYVSDQDPSSVLTLTLQKAASGRINVEIKKWPAKVLESARQAYLNRDNAAPLVDVTKLPRLPNAKESERSTAERTVYAVPGNLPATSSAITALLAADGWKPYVVPLDTPHSTWLTFVKGQQGLSVHFTILPGTNEETTTQTTVEYSADRLQFAPPYPDDATNIVLDERRPYLRLRAGGTVESLHSFYEKKLIANDWAALKPADMSARWPNAASATKSENESVAYYVRGENRIVSVAVSPDNDGKVRVELRVPSFAQPAFVEADNDIYGLPIPKPHKTAGGTNGRNSREVHAHVPAPLDAVLEFYRKALAARGWKEESAPATSKADGITLKFSAPDGDATLKLTQEYDLTIVSLVQLIKKTAADSAPASQGQSLDALLQQAQQMVREAERGLPPSAKPQPDQSRSTNSSGDKLLPLANNPAPIPLPDGAQAMTFDPKDGTLEFSTPSSVGSVADFFRTSMKQSGWQSQPSVINNANMAQLDFVKARKNVSITIMKMGAETNVRANGSGLEVANAKPSAPGTPTESSASTNPPPSDDDLVAEENGGLPVPKRHTMVVGTKTPFRREVSANVPLELGVVLDFYRRELGKQKWKEDDAGRDVTATTARIGFLGDDGTAVLKLGRKDNETTVSLIVKNPQAAKQAGVLPPPGKVKVLFGNILPNAASLTFDGKPISIPAGAGTKAPDGPSLDVAPGRYRYSIKSRGGVQNDEVDVHADETWGLMVGPGGILSLQAY